MRRAVGDEQDVYRVVIVRKKQVHNPGYEQGNRKTPYWLYLDETFEEHYGPYNKLGTARGVLTNRSLDGFGEPRPWFVSGRVEIAETTWRTVT
jgi:hypothetical protein